MRASSSVATKACSECRERKRKCDRLLPGCSLCYRHAHRRLGRYCHYDDSIRSYALSEIDPGTCGLERTPSSTPAGNAISRLEEEGIAHSSVTITVTRRLSDTLGDNGDLKIVREVASKYFKSVHLWYPIISQTAFNDRLSTTFTEPCAEFSLLIMSLALINSSPQHNTISLPLYSTVKELIAVMEAANIHSLEVVQARLLVSLYEVGHGFDTAAFISISGTVRAAVAIGLNRMVGHCSNGDTQKFPNSEQGLRVWWAIVILDRNYSLERGDGPCASHCFGSPITLPKDRSALEHCNITNDHPLLLSTPSSIGVGAFARQAQVSHLLNIFLTHVNDYNRYHEFDCVESDQIARTLTSFSMLIPEDSPQPWPTYCGAIGMCYGALMMLHDSRPRNMPVGGGIDAPESVESALKRLVRVATIFNQNIDQVDIDAISPFPPRGISKAASRFYQLWVDTGDLHYLNKANQLLTMLKHFSKRWLGAAKSLKDLENQRINCSNLHGVANPL